MSPLLWIVVGGVAMSAIALVGGVTLVLAESTLRRIIPPLVALAAGSLLGGALFHMLPAGVRLLGEGLQPYAWTAGGFVSFMVPFAAGNFIYIAAADLVPQVNRGETATDNIVQLTCFLVGLGGLFLLAATLG